MKKRIVSFFLAVVMAVGLVPIAGAAVPIGDYPYPDILKYSALDESFEEMAEDLILPDYRAYVLNAIKYHIESRYAGNTTQYRVAKNLMGAFNSVDGNLIFVFDGVSTNLKKVTNWTGTGYVSSDGSTSHLSAVCIVVRLNSKGMPEIAFASENASTFADQVRGNNKNDGEDHLTTLDGVYNMQAINHKGKYAALNIQGITTSRGIRFGVNSSYAGSSTSINFHYSYGGTTTSTSGNSTGCFTLGEDKTEYNDFINALIGFPNAYSSGVLDESRESATSPKLNYNGAFSYKWHDIVGIMILDRSNYTSGIEKMFGSDANRSAAQISADITAESQVWHEAILERMEEEEIKVSEITVRSGRDESAIEIYDDMIVNNFYYGLGTDVLSGDSDAVVSWEKNADTYDVWAAVMEGDPEPGKDVSLARLDNGTGWIDTTSNSITLSKSVMREHGGKWVKIAIAAKEKDGTAARTSCFYFLLSSVGNTKLRGDANGDGSRNTSDFTYALIHLVTGGLVNNNVAEDLDYNGDGEEKISDAIYLLIHIVTGGSVNSNLH